MHINIEFKAKSTNHDTIRNILKSKKADFKGIDHQIDTYFNVKKGRLKLRQGTIENSLIYYERTDDDQPKQSDVYLYRLKSVEGDNLKQVLTASLGIKVVVDKHREIYFIDNVKFHIDNVEQLGTFIEVEAIDEDGSIGKNKLIDQCDYYKSLFTINESDLISVSYSDLLLKL